MIWQSVFGCCSFIALAWLLSENRRRVSVRLVVKGLLLTFAAGLVLVYVPFSRDVFALLNRMVLALQEATHAGTSFVFGYVGGGPLPFAESYPGSSFILAFQALPMVLLMSALSSLLFYWKVLPVVVRAFAWCLRKTMGVGGAEGLANSVNVFVGMVEAPLFIRPYLDRMTRSELFSVMTCGMANVAGTVMALYASILGSRVPNAMGHILVASLLSLPASITIARIMIPETGEATAGEMTAPETATSSMDAVTKGTLEGVHLMVNIIGMLIVLVALDFRAVPGCRGKPGEPAAPCGPRHGAGLLAHGGAVVRSVGRRGPHGDQDGLERIDRLPGHEPPAGRHPQPAQPPDHDLRPVRVRQPRKPGDHDRRHEHHGSRPPH
jgi:CNT family concentrative nucleoside transporter